MRGVYHQCHFMECHSVASYFSSIGNSAAATCLIRVLLSGQILEKGSGRKFIN